MIGIIAHYNIKVLKNNVENLLERNAIREGNNNMSVYDENAYIKKCPICGYEGELL